MIKINVAQIKKRLVGEKPLAFELEPAELETSPEEMGIVGTVKLVGSMSNAVMFCFCRRRWNVRCSAPVDVA